MATINLTGFAAIAAALFFALSVCVIGALVDKVFRQNTKIEKLNKKINFCENKIKELIEYNEWIINNK